MQNTLDNLSTLSSKSIFLYGSRARNDSIKNSDYEIGIIFNEKNYVKRKELKKYIVDKSVSVYPFKENDIRNSNPDTPFQKNIYMYDLISSGKTLYGEKILETLDKPTIKILDLIQDISFCLGTAISAVKIDRVGNQETAQELFYKSCLYGTRNLLRAEKGDGIIGYDKIAKEAKKSDIGGFNELVENAYLQRVNKAPYSSLKLFTNIKYLNTIVQNRVLEIYENKGNIIL